METASEEGEFLNQYGVKEPEQIHILGSKQDIEGFKKFVNKNTSKSDIDISSLKEGIKSDMFRKMFEMISSSKVRS